MLRILSSSATTYFEQAPDDGEDDDREDGNDDTMDSTVS